MNLIKIYNNYFINPKVKLYFLGPKYNIYLLYSFSYIFNKNSMNTKNIKNRNFDKKLIIIIIKSYYGFSNYIWGYNHDYDHGY